MSLVKFCELLREPTCKIKQTFVTSAAKLALDKDLVLKTLDSVRNSYLHCYMWKNMPLAGRKDEMEKKKRQKRKLGKKMRRYGSYTKIQIQETALNKD